MLFSSLRWTQHDRGLLFPHAPRQHLPNVVAFQDQVCVSTAIDGFGQVVVLSHGTHSTGVLSSTDTCDLSCSGVLSVHPAFHPAPVTRPIRQDFVEKWLWLNPNYSAMSLMAWGMSRSRITHDSLSSPGPASVGSQYMVSIMSSGRTPEYLNQ